MRTIEVSLAARLCFAGTPKHAIIAAFKDAVSNGTSLVDELDAAGAADEAAIARAIAAETGLAFEDIPLGAQIIASVPADQAGPHRARQIAVLTKENLVLHYVAPSVADIAVLKDNLLNHPAARQTLRIATPSHLMEYMRTYREPELMENCVRRHEIKGAEQSSRVVLSGRQGIVVGILGSLVLFTLALDFQALWLVCHILFSLFFFGCIVMRLLALRTAKAKIVAASKCQSSRELPRYGVMIALYKEAAVVPQIIGAMQELKWPRSRLEVIFLCESDDHDTLQAFKREKLPPGFRVVPVPNLGPRTKPKALNYGLQLIRGEYIVVYDAEDRPHPDQLLEAWKRFRTGDGNLGCLQAPLVIANAMQGWLPRLFAFEYATHFNGLLPWLAGNRYILPLGGSSNHFRRECLDRVRGWDPFNVTEDAELGTRLARHGYEISVLSLPTLEDAPIATGVWLRQRTRWLKGWMQTWLVEMRDPGAFMRDVGLQRFFVYQVLVAGIIISSLLYLPMLLAIVYGTLCAVFLETSIWGRGIFIVDCINIAMGFLSFHALGKGGPVGRSITLPVLRWLPVYWLMISAAAWRALWQLQAAPFLWEKTPHRPSEPAH